MFYSKTGNKWTGHMGELLMEYTLHKGLDDETRERLRAAYKRADEAHLTTMGRKPGVPEDKLVAMLRKEWLKLANYSEEEIAKLGDLAAMTHERLRELTRRQKVVAMSELKLLELVHKKAAEELRRKGIKTQPLLP
jgi:predicted nucleotidyltransferase